jgi:hypothetical protein
MCALLIILLIALINLVAVGGINTPPFQCEYNDNVTISSYIKENYDFYDVEQIEEFIAWKGAFELAYLLENTDDAPYKYEVYDILKFFFGNYKEENGYILKYLNRCSPPMEETNALQDPLEEEIAETGSSLDEKEEEELSSYPCLPPNKSNSLTNTLFDRPPGLPKEDEFSINNCDDPIDSFEKSLLMKLILAILVTLILL